ncbi:hypothetical protein BDQ12DRAFT_668349 [Crucibulum laeve]|uniref:Uncharacterized protein n=1 Tax=Crucibulum laeve TaxID=68775 RepID=A0A5C3LSG8_9AGAR|nr:hypothetical protein BDQ12DRAFT_668349 [Crucibulum laeve]
MWVRNSDVPGRLYNVFWKRGYESRTQLTARLLRARRLNPEESATKNRILRGYIVFMFILSTIATITDILATVDGLINVKCPDPGQTPLNPYFGRVDVIYAFLNWGSDGLLVWRCLIIYSNCRVPRWVIIALPCSLFISLLAYGFITLCLNTIITIMIVGRICIYRRRISKVFGPTHCSDYTSIIAMLVESAALVAIFDLFFLISFSLHSASGYIAFQMWIQVQSITPLLIIFRVAQGTAWSNSTTQMTAQATSLHFNRNTEANTLEEHPI